MMSQIKLRSPLSWVALPALGSVITVLLAAPARSMPELVSQKASDLMVSADLEGRSPLPPAETLDAPSLTQSSEDLAQELAQAATPKPEPQELAQATTPDPTPESKPASREESPVIERWQKQVPNILDDIKRDPSFRTRVRLGLSYFPSTFDSLGWNAGVEDIFLLRLGYTGLTISGDYQATFTGARKAGGVDLRYYLLPLGGYVNIAPVLGYRYLETPRYITDGLNVGFRLQVVASRTGAADLSFTQTWVAPQQSDEVGVSKLSFGYALTKNLRLSTDVEKQNSKQKKDTRFGLSLEWMF